VIAHWSFSGSYETTGAPNLKKHAVLAIKTKRDLPQAKSAGHAQKRECTGTSDVSAFRGGAQEKL
jgi:hypothetical protein